MLTIMWGLDGFHIVDFMTKQHSYNTHNFLRTVMEPLPSVIFPDGRKPHSRGLSVHLDNCRIHSSKASKDFLQKLTSFECHIQLIVLASRDFWFFGRTTKLLFGRVDNPIPSASREANT
jgi:hypothetical protein